MRHALFALLLGVGSSVSASAADFTHTWKKTDGHWQIITGMCAAQEPLKTPRL
jgi:hypothetical protein